MDIQDWFVYLVMLCLAPIFLVIFACSLLILSPILVPYELMRWWVRRQQARQPGA